LRARAAIRKPHPISNTTQALETLQRRGFLMR
jgi:hypothetical protein